MESPLFLAFQITLVGMTLVFGAILLLWAVMSLLMRLAPERSLEKPGVEMVVAAQDDEHDLQQCELQQLELKQRAALAAVGVALARQSGTELHEFPLPPTPIVSAWQAVLRTKMINKRGPVR